MDTILRRTLARLAETSLMQRQEQLSRLFLENLLWFLVSLVVAFFVWVIANTQSDPIAERQFRQLPIQIQPEDGLLITNTFTSTASVTVRAQQTVLDLLTNDDIVVRADLNDLGPGTHVVPLEAQVSRRALVADTQPIQITVILEAIEAKKVPVAASITKDVQLDLDRDEPVFSENQIEVSGAASRVAEVVAVEVVLDLSQQRNPYEQDLRLVPVDADGQTVDKVTLESQTVHVRVNIRQRNDVRQVSVRPNILFGTLPQGYFLSSISYDPQTILLSGDLSNVPEALLTAPIELTDHKSDFEITVPVEIPEGNLQVLGSQTVTVYVGIAAPTSNLQFENVPVDVIGVAQGRIVKLTPERVTVLITGPQPVLESLQADDIDVVVDVNGLGDGSHEAIPIVSVTQDLIPTASISLLPTSVDVEITLVPEETPPVDRAR